MKLSKSDLPLLRWPLAIFTVAVLIAATALFFSGQYAERIAKERQSANNMLSDARRHLAAAREDEQNMVFYASEYQALDQSGVIGDGKRLDWMEGLENIRRQQPKINFSYIIAPQRPYAPKPALNSGSFDLHYSEMILQFDLLHEGQLVDFFTALRTQIKGWYQLEDCALQRAHHDNDGDDTAGSRLKASCTGGWITLKQRGAS